MTNKIENINPNTLFIGKKIIYLPNCHSTNDSTQLILGNNDVFEGTTIVTNRQTSGKGQKGNHWQSEPGKNLTFSIILKPDFLDVKQQFKLNFAVSLGIFDFLSSFLKSHVKIKWPNDIYYKDSKIAGILIENSIRSMKMQHSIVGIGINVNQVNFEKVGYAVSMKTISGKEYSLENMLADLLGFFEVRYLQLKSNKHKILKSDYMQCLYWYEEKRLFRIPDSGFRFSDYKFEKNQLVEGKIIGIDESGKLGIKIGKEAVYFGFKEIEFVK